MGLRAQTRRLPSPGDREADGVRLLSRNGKNLAKRFPPEFLEGAYEGNGR